MNFIKEKTLYYYVAKEIYNESIGFDLDYTLICPKSGNKFPIDINDYKWLNNVQSILNNLKYNVVIFTNQLKFVPEFLIKIQKLRDELNFDFSIFISTENDMYRKPNINIHTLYTKLTGHKIIKYIGDACGRINDHSFCDAYFAYNLKIDIETPEYFFNKDLSLFKYKDDPYNLYKLNGESPINYDFKHPFVIFLCGFPASGKSTYYNKHLNKYEYINQDILKTKDKTKKTVQLNIKLEKSFVIDKTFPTIEDRAEYLELIPTNYNKYCIYINTPMFIARHLNHIRNLETGKSIPDIVYRTFNKNFVKPNSKIKEFDDVFEYKPQIIIDHKLIDSIQKSELQDLSF